MFLWCVRDGWRDMYSKRGLLLRISSSGSQRMQKLAPPCKHVRDASDWVRVPRSTAILCTLSKSDCVIIFTNPSARAGYDTRSVFKRSLTGLNSECSFSQTTCLTKAEEPSLPYYFPIAGRRIIGFIPLPRVLVLSEMQ